MKVTVIAVVISTLGTIPKGLVKGLKDIINIGQNTEKSSGGLRKLAVTQTPMGNHQRTLVWKTKLLVVM